MIRPDPFHVPANDVGVASSPDDRPRHEDRHIVVLPLEHLRVDTDRDQPRPVDDVRPVKRRRRDDRRRRRTDTLRQLPTTSPHQHQADD